MTDTELLSNRLRILEDRFRQAKLLAVLACVFLVALVIRSEAQILGLDQLDPLQTLPKTALALQSPVQAEVRSQRFILVDEMGRERASLQADAAGSVFFVMFDGAGKHRANLSVTPAGPSLVFFDPSGQARTVLGSTALVASHSNNERAPASSIVLFDKDGKLLFRQP